MWVGTLRHQTKAEVSTPTRALVKGSVGGESDQKLQQKLALKFVSGVLSELIFL